jgi:hypothetical protein
VTNDATSHRLDLGVVLGTRSQGALIRSPINGAKTQKDVEPTGI